MTLCSIIVVIFGPYNVFPNGKMEIFYLCECDLSDLLNMYCKVWKWHDGKKWMCATMLWRNCSLAVNILGDITKIVESAQLMAELKKLKTYSWKLKMVYWKVKTYSWKLKVVYWKLKTIENKMLTSVYDAHKNKNNYKRVIGTAQLCLSAVLKIRFCHSK